MPVNINNSLPPKHACYLAGTGGGKTTAVKLLKFVGECAAIFDMYGDYRYDARSKSPFNGLGGRPVYHYKTRRAFATAFADAWRSGQKFVVAYSPEFSDKLTGEKLTAARRTELFWFGSLMWAAGDGNRELHIIVEELAKLARTAGKDDTIIGEIATGGRKFGLVLHSIFQRSQEVPKTIWNNSPRKVLGAQEAKHDAKQVSIELDVDMSDVIALSLKNGNTPNKLHYLVKSKGGIGNVDKYSIDIKTGEYKKES